MRLSAAPPLRRSADPALAEVAEAASEVGVVRRALAPFRDANGNAAYSSPVTYPKSGDSDFPQRLAGLAAMIAAGLSLRCVVLVHVWSEFGRRAQENRSAGTDHGAAGVSLLVGTRASGRMVGEWPGLTALDSNGNLRENVDFRGVYCSLIEQWFGADPTAIIPSAGSFPRYTLIR